MVSVFRSLSSIVLLASTAIGQVEWRKAATMEARSGHAMAYDVTRQRSVLFGGHSGVDLGDTWEWDGATWTLRAVSGAPAPRRDHAMAYDVGRGRVVLFGGVGAAGGFRDTWEWDGTTWAQRTPAVSPPTFGSLAMAYDVRRARTVVFGAVPGLFGGGVGETWEWDGSTWTQRSPATVPSVRLGHAMACDLANGKVVMFGGFDGQFASAPFAETWEWDGIDWTRRNPATSPAGRIEHGLVYDLRRGRVVLVGGKGTDLLSAPRSDTWEWDGNTWARRSPATVPRGLASHAMAYDVGRSRVVAWGGWLASTETWEWDGTDWVRAAPESSPAVRRVAAAVFDESRGRALLVGLDSDVYALPWRCVTWEWDGARWSLRAPLVRPPGRSEHALTYDGLRRRVLLFGGDDGTRYLDDMWSWDGNDWQQLVSPAPPPRAGHDIAFDPHRGVAVLFGGRPSPNPVPALSDTWEWDGSVWTRRSPTTVPPARFEHALAYDARRRKVVMFGGLASSLGPVLGDTWLWDGSDWARAAPTTSPRARTYHDMAYDSARERVVLFGGQVLGFPTTPVDDTWDWDGTDWRRRTTAIAPPPRGWNSMAYDAVREQVLSFGGANFGDTWLLVNPAQARYATFGGGCPGAAGTPLLAAVAGGRPWVGDAFDLELRHLRPGVVAFLITGFSKTVWGATPLPLSLSFLGMPGCELRVSVDAAEVLPNIAGTAVFRIHVPNQAALLGARFFHQGIGFDPGANPFGAVVSNAAEGLIGAR